MRSMYVFGGDLVAPGSADLRGNAGPIKITLFDQTPGQRRDAHAIRHFRRAEVGRWGKHFIERRKAALFQ